jgi:thiol:disulfide interchange protein
MGKESKTIVFILVVLVAGFLLLRPYLWPAAGSDAEFITTSNPQAAMDRALSEGRPVFLEFYSDT